VDIELAELSRRVFQIHDEIAEEGKPSELASAVVMDARELAVAKYLDKLFKGKSACVDEMNFSLNGLRNGAPSLLKGNNQILVSAG